MIFQVLPNPGLLKSNGRPNGPNTKKRRRMTNEGLKYHLGCEASSALVFRFSTSFGTRVTLALSPLHCCRASPVREIWFLFLLGRPDVEHGLRVKEGACGVENLLLEHVPDSLAVVHSRHTFRARRRQPSSVGARHTPPLVLSPSLRVATACRIWG